VLLWKRGEPTLNSEIVLIREFRPPAATPDGFIRELPGGSAKKEKDPLEVAAEEVHEETGFYIDPKRLKAHGARQLAGTLSSHKSSLFAAEITDEELDWFKSQKDVEHGLTKEGEHTFIEVSTLQKIIDDPITDWTTLGQILSVVMESDE